MNAQVQPYKNSHIDPYARCIATSKRVRWEIEKDVIRKRQFDSQHKFLPDGLSQIEYFGNLSRQERCFISQIQGRTYANIFGLVERFINAKVLEVSRDYWLDNQVALEALIRFSDEELKHQELFRKIDQMMAEVMPDGYCFDIDANGVAEAVLGKSTWAVLALTLDIELFTQLHYKASIDADPELSPLFKDVFKFHWQEESQHAILDELEWIRHDAGLDPQQRQQGVDDLIMLVAAIDQILQAQAAADCAYFIRHCDRVVDSTESQHLQQNFLKAYRWQYIHSGTQFPRFTAVLSKLISPEQGQQIAKALQSL